MDRWDPRKDDFEDKSFNSYTKGPGRNLSIKKNYTHGSEKQVQLYVTGIPLEITEEGIESLFGRSGTVNRVKKMVSKRENAQDTFGFVTMATLGDAEKAIADLNNFNIDKFTLRVTVSMSKEEMDKRRLQRQDASLMSARGFDEDSSASDKEETWGGAGKPSKMNGLGPTGDNTSSIGAGRGQKLREITRVSPAGDAKPIAINSNPSKLENLTVQVDRDVNKQNANALFKGPTQPGPVGRGIGQVNANSSMGRGRGYGMEQQLNSNESFNRRGGHNRGSSYYNTRGMRRGRGQFHNNYGGYGEYPPMMGQPMPYPSYVYVDPYMMGGMGAPQLLQPAYGMMNTSVAQPTYMPQQQATMSLPTPMPKEEDDVSRTLHEECSLCGKLGVSRCSKCKLPYCSRVCQERDWPEHKLNCRQIGKELKDAETFDGFEVNVDDELIPQVKKLMEKATGDIIQVSKKPGRGPGLLPDPTDTGKNDSGASRRKLDNGQGRRETEKAGSRDKDMMGQGRRDAEKSNRHDGEKRAQGRRDDRRGKDRSREQRNDKRDVSGKSDDKEMECYNCHQNGHRSKYCPKKVMEKCYNCQQPGHHSKECPQKTVMEKCYNCQQPGHHSKECPQKTGNQQRTSPSSRNRKQSSPKYSNDAELDKEPVSTRKSPEPVFIIPKPAFESTPKDKAIPKKTPPTPPPKKSLAAVTMPLNQEINVVLTEVVDPGHFFVQMVLEECTRPLFELMAMMAKKLENSVPDVNSVLTGEIYAVKFSLDGSWNRAQVVKVSEDSIQVQFIDFGNKETTKLENIRQLTDDVLMHPAQGVLCAIEDIIPKSGSGWNISEGQLRAYLTPDVQYHATCNRTLDTPAGKLHKVVLKNDARQLVSQQLISAELVNARTGATTLPQPGSYPSKRTDAELAEVVDARTGAETLPQPGSYPGKRTDIPLMVADIPKAVDKLSVGQEFHLMIADGKSPTHFSIQVLNEDNIAVFTAFNTRFNDECRQSTDTEYRPKFVGELVASKFSLEDGWYRAEVMELVSTGAKVVFVDYLNSETVAFNMMRRATPMCATFPAQGILCCVQGINEPADGVWPQEINALFERLSQTALKGTMKEIRNQTAAMELKELSGESVTETIKDILRRNAQGLTAPNPPSPTLSLGASGGLPPLVSTRENRSIKAGELPLDGAKVLAMVSNVSAVDCVYIQELVPEMDKTFNKMMCTLNEMVKPDPRYEPQEGEFVAAVYSADGNALWYRGEVKVKVSENSYMILFIDYGNTDCVQGEAIAPLAKQFQEIPAKAIRCQLAGSELMTESETLKNLKALTDAKLYVRAVDFRHKIYKVEMFLIDGTNVNEAFECQPTSSANSTPKLSITAPAAIPQPAKVEESRLNIATSQLPLDGTDVASKVVLIEDLTCFYIHLVDPETDHKLMECLKAMQMHYREDTKMYIGQNGEYVAALFDDGSGAVWYRAKVIHTVGNEVKVSIIDYGNIGFVGTECIRKLDRTFSELPAVAVKCKLNGCTGKESQDTVNDFRSVESTPLNVRAISIQGETFLVDMILTDALKTSVSTCLGLNTSVSQPGTPNKVVTETANNLSISPARMVGIKSPVSSLGQNISVLADCKLPIGEDVYAVSYVIDSILSFYVQKADEETQKSLATMMLELAEVCRECNREHRASAGEIVAALFIEDADANWYRGQVIELLDSNQCKVHFVDYGNTEAVFFRDIRRLDPRFLLLPRMAVNCELSGVGTETNEMLQKFKTISNVPMTVRAKSVSNGTYKVEVITSDNTNMNADLGLLTGGALPTARSSSTDIVDNLPKAISPVKNPLPKKVSSPPKGERKQWFSQTLAKSRPQGTEFRAVITSIGCPNQFHCQMFPERDQSTLQDLQFLSETMQLECEHVMDETDTFKFEVGELCCAKFTDGSWYRAVVLEVFLDRTVKVEYVDFGNQSEVPTMLLRPVTEDYTRLPLLAFRCTLHGVRPVGTSWTEEARTEMSKFQDKELNAKVVGVNNDIYNLELTDMTGNDMAKHLISVDLAQAEDTETAGMSEMERLRREKDVLQRQLEAMQAQMVAIQKGNK